MCREDVVGGRPPPPPPPPLRESPPFPRPPTGGGEGGLSLSLSRASGSGRPPPCQEHRTVRLCHGPPAPSRWHPAREGHRGPWLGAGTDGGSNGSNDRKASVWAGNERQAVSLCITVIAHSTDQQAPGRGPRCKFCGSHLKVTSRGKAGRGSPCPPPPPPPPPLPAPRRVPADSAPQIHSGPAGFSLKGHRASCFRGGRPGGV